jgi:2'-5' RNA ligase
MEISIYSNPPKELFNKINKVMKELEKVFGKNPAGYCPPHITMRSGLIFPKKELNNVVLTLKQEFSKIKKPVVKIRNLWVYDGNNVFVIQLEIKNKKEIEKVYKKLESLFPKYTKGYIIKKFNPHISLAWNFKKNLSKEVCKKTISYLKKRKFNLKADYKLDILYIYEKKGNKFELVRKIK